jgi:hypothetical protein
MCGATDCVACRGPGADAGPDEENSERPWLANSGYTLDEDGSWERQISYKQHTCRRDHKDGRVKKGDVYRVSRTRSIDDETGDGWIRTSKWVIRYAASAA